MKQSPEMTPEPKGKKEPLDINSAFDGIKEGDEYDEQMEIEFDDEDQISGEPFIPLVEDDIPEPPNPLEPSVRAPEEDKDSEAVPESQDENLVEDKDNHESAASGTEGDEAATTEENVLIPFEEGKEVGNLRGEGGASNLTEEPANAPKRNPPRPESLPSHQQAAAGVAGGVWGLGQLVKTALGLDSNRIRERVSKRAEANYQKNIDKLLGAYADAWNAIDNMADSGAAQVRDQYRKDGVEPPKSILKQLAEDDEFSLNNEKLKSSLNEIELYSKKLGPSAKAAGLDMSVAEDFLDVRNEELSKRAEKVDQLVDKDGKSIFDSIKNVVEKVKQVITAFLARIGLSAGQQQEQIG